MPSINEFARAHTLTEAVCIVDSHHGIYVPQVWAERYGSAAIESAGVSADDVSDLSMGPECAAYWDAWDSVLSDYCHEVAGVKHYLMQDGDLFEYPDTYSWED